MTIRPAFIAKPALWIAVVTLSFGWSTASSPATLPPTVLPYDLSGAMVYSDLCVEAQSGDIAGLRIFVRPPGVEPRVLAQYAEGGLLQPEPATWTEDGRDIAIEVPGDVPEATFSGRVTADFAIMRSRQPGAKPFRLGLTRHPDKAAICGPVR